MPGPPEVPAVDPALDDRLYELVEDALGDAVEVDGYGTACPTPGSRPPPATTWSTSSCSSGRRTAHPGQRERDAWWPTRRAAATPTAPRWPPSTSRCGPSASSTPWSWRRCTGGRRPRSRAVTPPTGSASRQLVAQPTPLRRPRRDVRRGRAPAPRGPRRRPPGRRPPAPRRRRLVRASERRERPGPALVRVGEVEVDETVVRGHRQAAVGAAQRRLGLPGEQQHLRHQPARTRLVLGPRARGALPVVGRGVRAPQHLLVVVRRAVRLVDEVPHAVVGLHRLPPVEVAGGGRRRVVAGDGAGERPAGLQHRLQVVQQPDPPVLGARPRERAAGEVPVHQPDPGEPVAGRLDRPLHPAGRLLRHGGVVEHVPGLHEPSGRAVGGRHHLLDRRRRRRRCRPAARCGTAGPGPGGSTNDVPWNQRRVHSESVTAAQTCCGVAAT